MTKQQDFRINNKKSGTKIVCEFLGNLFFCYCVIFALALILFSSVTIECEVIGSSMYPTLNNTLNSRKNDVVFVNVYDKDLEYLDIIVVKTETDNIIKRVVGLAGDKIDIVKVENQYLLERNGKIIEEKYINKKVSPAVPAISQNGMDKTYERFNQLKSSQPESFVDGKYVVPENSVFVLGDNRSVSLDSSHYGAFDFSKIEGKVEYIKHADMSDFEFYYYYILEGKFFQTLFNLF